ncbi:MAG: hypothetical protein KatS3mg091_845 [Patescibacteria group bacterium]|nr:MAG: hypothetical protein KatS3mg090_0978 [Patescibacteria group bacterium]GIW63733.1 MAG: hypothetical protein KatS3mg091_535 [Patescibacteria group bacterium]GIW64043.1 MAG: hypothetical protein KatS3mg091_845 [Patescibacteria group bacterium]
MNNQANKLKLKLNLSKAKINSVIVVVAGLAFFGLVVFLAITYLNANDEGVDQLRLEVQAEQKTYRKSVFLANNSVAQQPTPNFAPTPTPVPTDLVEPTPTEGILASDEQEQTPVNEQETIPTDIVVATPSVEVPTPTEEVLLADAGQVTPTPVAELPEAGFINNYLLLLIISAFIIFIALFI